MLSIEENNYEELLYLKLFNWWLDYAYHEYHVDLKTEAEVVMFLLKTTLISRTLLRKFFIERTIDKRFIYYSVMYGFDLPTETNCYIKIYDDRPRRLQVNLKDKNN